MADGVHANVVMGKERGKKQTQKVHRLGKAGGRPAGECTASERAAKVARLSVAIRAWRASGRLLSVARPGGEEAGGKGESPGQLPGAAARETGHRGSARERGVGQCVWHPWRTACCPADTWRTAGLAKGDEDSRGDGQGCPDAGAGRAPGSPWVAVACRLQTWRAGRAVAARGKAGLVEEHVYDPRPMI